MFLKFFSHNTQGHAAMDSDQLCLSRNLFLDREFGKIESFLRKHSSALMGAHMEVGVAVELIVGSTPARAAARTELAPPPFACAAMGFARGRVG